jgi:hypothetical protein
LDPERFFPDPNKAAQKAVILDKKLTTCVRVESLMISLIIFAMIIHIINNKVIFHPRENYGLIRTLVVAGRVIIRDCPALITCARTHNEHCFVPLTVTGT